MRYREGRCSMYSCRSMLLVAVIVVGSVGWLVFIAMLGVLIYYRRYAVPSVDQVFEFLK